MSDGTDDALPELDCAKCGYPLRGLSAAVACPECGHPQADSMRAFLPHADPIWLGCMAKTTSAMIFTGCLCLLTNLPRLFPALAGTYLDVQAYTIFAIDTFVVFVFFTQREVLPPSPERALSARQILRYLSGALVLVYLLGRGPIQDDPTAERIEYAVQSILMITGSVAYLVYWRQLARRARDAFLIRHIPIAVGGLIVVQTISLALWMFADPYRGSIEAENKLIDLGAVIFVSYQVNLLIHFRSLLMSFVREHSNGAKPSTSNLPG